MTANHFTSINKNETDESTAVIKFIYDVIVKYVILQKNVQKAPLIRSRPWRYINLLTYLLTYLKCQTTTTLEF